MKRLIGSAILILTVALVGCAQDDGSADTDGDAVASAPTATIAEAVIDDTGSGDDAEEIDEPAELYAPVVTVVTNTPPAATNTPEATATPVPTAVLPTNTPVPIQPTSPPPPPPPPPTAVPPTEPPPPPPPPAIGANGLVASNFAVQERADLKVKGPVWFEFTIANSTGGDVGYNSLGVMPKKDGVDRPEWYQQSWSGEGSKVRPGGMSWEDNIKLPEAGDYTLRLVICFDGLEVCTTGGGTFHSLSGEVPVTIRS